MDSIISLFSPRILKFCVFISKLLSISQYFYLSLSNNNERQSIVSITTAGMLHKPGTSVNFCDRKLELLKLSSYHSFVLITPFLEFLLCLHSFDYVLVLVNVLYFSPNCFPHIYDKENNMYNVNLEV